MADVTNVYSDLVPKLFGDAITVLRQNSIMPRLVRNWSSTIAEQPGSTINIPLQPVGTTRAVAPDATAADPGAVTVNTTPLVLNNWREAPFVLSDKERAEIADGTIPSILRAYVQALAEYIDAQIMAQYLNVYNTGAADNFGGGATAVPPAFVVDATKNPSGFRAIGEAGALLDNWGAPPTGRVVVLSPRDNWDASFLGPFLKANESGTTQTIQERQIGRKIGMDWWMDQAIPTQTAGTVGTTAAQTLTCPTAAIGVTAITFVGTITTGLTLKVGDVFKFSNDSQTYVNNTLVTSTTNSLVVSSFSPPLRVAVTAANTAAVLGSHKANLMFHPDAIGFASRPLGGVGSGYYAEALDPISGLNLRLEIYRQNKRDLVSVDCLFGVKMVEPRLAARIASIV
jgi:hypothetical protein